MKPPEGKIGVRLTEKRLAVLRWVAVGKTNAEIGAILRLSPATIKNVVKTLGVAYGCAGSGQRMRIVMAALIQGDLTLDEFRTEFESCKNAGRILR